MSTMVPARDPSAWSLADVLPSCVAALRGVENRLGFAPARQVVVLIVDGLGSSALKQRAGYARTLAAAATPLFCGFPTTTASSIATITTGVLPGEHGLVGYSVLDPEHDRVVKQLSGWDSRMDPATWQRVPTIFERATAEKSTETSAGSDGSPGQNIRAFAIGPSRYAHSGLTKAILRGAEYRSAESVEARFEAAGAVLREAAPSLSYVYVPELDVAGHKYGWESPQWSAALELVDSQLRTLVSGLKRDQAVVVTADHGMVDINPAKHVLYGHRPELVEGVRHFAGEPRCLQLHFEPGLDDEARSRLVAAWHESEDARSWVVTRDEAIEAGWFGPVDASVRPRIGDLLVAARKGIAYYADADVRGRGMVGQHGSWSAEESQVPLARFGAFA
ncbi:nucleotide pyrophosphatase/phosphodiesterase family protein [Frondihabitans sp. 4ASC-45]|uniref:alkaline phosphatase family protein n=1 Tax=Frondihabitans sp. 4ASC-45 TaxID=3111636 RepID=UPI003C20671C